MSFIQQIMALLICVKLYTYLREYRLDLGFKRKHAHFIVAMVMMTYPPSLSLSGSMSLMKKIAHMSSTEEAKQTEAEH